MRMYKLSFLNQFAVLFLSFAVASLNASDLPTVAAELLGAATLQSPHLIKNNAGTSVKGSTSYGGGVGGEFVIPYGLGLEVDALYLSHKFSQESREFFGSQVSTSYTSGYLHFPALIRYRPIPYINLGAGAYYSRVITSWTVAAAGHSSTITDYGRNDWGCVFALGSALPISEALSLVADIRYARSLSKTARKSGDALRFSDFQVLLGLRMGML